MTFLKRDEEFATFFFYWEHGRIRNSLMGKMEVILPGLIAGQINTYISVHKTLN